MAEFSAVPPAFNDPAARPERGRLKVFLGYAPGVGKTHTLLEAAHRLRQQGQDVVIGWVKPAPPPETEALLAGLEVIPPLEQDGRQWMDVAAVLERRPEVALVDDLASANPAGARHPRRYLDVEELLEHGISVYATMDIQQLESLKDVVQKIIGQPVGETVPDWVFDKAAVIELVDLPPEELLQRLQEDKIELPQGGSAVAAHDFFRLGNLTALRELSLRRTAERLDGQMRDYMQRRDIRGPWAASERLMVCVSSHPLSERLVRAGRRLADDLNAEWFVVYIETPDRLRFSQPHSERLANTLRLAEDLGAQVRKVAGQTVPEAVADFAQKNNITKIIAGNPLRPRWQQILSGSVVDEIIRRSGASIDVYVISDESGPVEHGIPSAWRPHSRWPRYLFSALLVVLTTLVAFPLHFVIEPTNLVVLYLGVVMIAALYLGRGPSMLASLLSVLAFDYFLVEPRFSLSVEDTQYILTFLGLLLVGLVISNLAGQVRNQVEDSRQREARTAALYALSRTLTASLDLESILQTVVEQIGQIFSREVVILLPQKEGLVVRAASSDFVLSADEKEVAEWAFAHASLAGRGTDTLSAARVRFQPLRTAQDVVGVLGVRPTDLSSYLSPEQRQLLDAFGSLAAVAIERGQLAEEANQVRVSRATEKLQTALLNTISHDLRTPLATITGVFSSLHEAETAQPGMVEMDSSVRLDLVDTGWEEAERLNRLVGNLLDMTRLEGGALRVRRVSADLEDVVGAALTRLHNRLKEHPIKTQLPADLPMVSMDVVLIEQVLLNLLDNAVKYSQPGSQLLITARRVGAEVEVSIADEGRGLPPEDLMRIFEKFYRVRQNDSISGTGLGLSICKGIIEAHGGQIWAQNRPEGGARFTFTLPLEQAGGWDES